MSPRLSIEGVGKSYGQQRVLDRVDLQVQTHEVVCLIGASGSGKSTLLRCVNLLIPYDEGTIRLDGIPIDDRRSLGRNGLRKRVGIVFQAYNLFPHRSVLDNITLAPRKVHGVARDVAESHARDLLALLGMARFADAYPEQLSGGEQQRVAIVRALATNPDVLLLDEVTASLDPELIGEVLKVIRGLKEEGMTMIIVTHEMGFAREIADRVAFLHDGRIVEDAPPGELFSSPRHPQTRRFLQRIIDAGRL